MVAPLEVTAYRSPGRDSTAGGRPWAGRPVTGTIRTPCCLARSSAAWVRGVKMCIRDSFAAGQGTPVAEAAQRHPKVYQELIYAAALCNDASLDPDHPGQIIGDPTEGALIYLAQAFGIDHEDLEETYPRLFEQPFDSDRKRMRCV